MAGLPGEFWRDFSFFAVFLLLWSKKFRIMNAVAWLKCHPGPQWLRPPSLKTRRFLCADQHTCRDFPGYPNAIFKSLFVSNPHFPGCGSIPAFDLEIFDREDLSWIEDCLSPGFILYFTYRNMGDCQPISKRSSTEPSLRISSAQ